MPMTNIVDSYGNAGFRQWQRIPETTTWYFSSGDLLSNGIMQFGWHEFNGKLYYFQPDINDQWYGRAMIGTQVIDGKTYNFDSNGALIG